VVEPRIAYLAHDLLFEDVKKLPLSLECLDLWEKAGLRLDEWQQYVILNSLVQDKNGHWKAFEVGVNVPRQNGKGAILTARQLAGLFVLGEELFIHSAHQFDTSLEAFARLLNLIEESELQKEIKRVSRSHGDEGVEVRGGYRVRFRTRTRGGGRGFSCDCLGLDEDMFMPEFTQSALFPTVRARPNPQIWYCGSAVDQEIHEHGVVKARLRQRALKGEDADLNYFEWSADIGDPEQDDPEKLDFATARDPEVWEQANPALGIRIDATHVVKEQRALDPRGFAVELLGVGDWPRTDHVAANPIDFEDWKALAGDGIIRDPQVVAFDVSPERKGAIVIAGLTKDGLVQGELVESKGGTLWLPPRVAGIVKKHKVVAYCDGRGPSASLIPELRDLGIEVEPLSASDHAAACGNLLDGIERKTVTHLDDQELNGAVRAARTRPLGDAWAWSRKDSSTNIAPLVAFTIAISAVMTAEKPRKASYAWA
jgi:phage terminase large subunit-like protein